MTDSWRLWVTIPLGLVVVSCGYSAPYRSSGPAWSEQGVGVAIAGERCYVNRTAEPFPTTVGDDRFNLDLRVELTNKSDHVAVVNPQSIVLSETVQGMRTAVAPKEQGDFRVQPGETTTVSLQFENTGELDCHHGLALDAGRAITVDGHPVALAPIQFSAVD